MIAYVASAIGSRLVNSEPERGIGRDATGRLPCRSQHRQVHLLHEGQKVRKPQAGRSDGLAGTGEGGEEAHVFVLLALILVLLALILVLVALILVLVALILVRLLVLAGLVTFYTCGSLHLRRIKRTGRPVRKGDETGTTGSESVEGVRCGGPLLRRARGALEPEHGCCGELQVDCE